MNYREDSTFVFRHPWVLTFLKTFLVEDNESVRRTERYDSPSEPIFIRLNVSLGLPGPVLSEL